MLINVQLVIIVLTVTIIVTVISWAIFIINVIVMDMTISIRTSARIWVSPLKTKVVEGRSAATYWKQSLRNLRKIVGTIFDQFRLWTNMILLDLDKYDLT